MEARKLHQWLQDDRATALATSRAPAVLVAQSVSESERWLASIVAQAFPGGSVRKTGCMRDSLIALQSGCVDIAVIDLQLRDGSGIDFVRECSRLSPSTRCVVTTTDDEDDDFLPVFAAGALGYLFKNQPEAVLIQQMRLLAEGVPPLAPSIAQRLVRHFMEQREPQSVGEQGAGNVDQLARLSHREKEVLTLIGKGMNIAEIAKLLHIATNTVCSHIKNIYRKRDLSSRAEAALEAQRLGLI